MISTGNTVSLTSIHFTAGVLVIFDVYSANRSSQTVSKCRVYLVFFVSLIQMTV